MGLSHSLKPEHGQTLIEMAARAIDEGLAENELEVDPAAFDPSLAEIGGSFVSLHRNSELLGCIGTLDPQHPLICDVAANAFGAAFRDPRLPAVTRQDLAELRISVAVVGPLTPLAAHSYDDLLDQLVPHIDGLVVSVGRSRATFLPSVWQQAPDPSRFVALLWVKGGFDPRSWPRGVRLHRYRTTVFTADSLFTGD